MAEEFDPEAYMDSKLDPQPAALGPPPGAPPEDERGDRDDEKKKSSRKDRSRSRSRERRRSRSKDRRRSGDDRYSKYTDPGRGSGRERERDRSRDRQDRREPVRRYDENFKLETESRGMRSDSKKTDPLADDEDGFDRDMRTLFVAQVARKADERDLFTFFSECGKVQDVRIIKDTQSRKSKGIAYVEFEKQEQVVAALAKSGQTLCGFPIVVQASQAEKNQAARLAAQVAGDMEVPTKVRVENLHPDIAEQDLTDLFTPFGKVVSVRIEKINNRSSGLGHVEFKSLPDAQKAVAHLHGFELAGKTLRVVMTAQPPPATGTIPVNPGLMGQIGQPAMMMGMMQQPGGMPGMPNMQLQMMLQQRAAMGNAPNMPAQETLDDGEFGGVHVSAQSRHMLMQKLARNTDLQGLGLQFAPTMPAPGPPGLGMPGMPKGIPGVPMGQANPSTYLLLVNMFDPAKEEDPNFHLDIQEDVKEECQAKFGQVIQCIANKTNANGLVYLQFDSIESAAKAQAGLQGRFFAGKQIQATYLAQAVFDSSLPRNQ